jgi:hypothetical protein
LKNLLPHGGLRALTRLAGGSCGEMLRCYSQALDLAILEGNINEVITVYLKATVLEAPLQFFTMTWQVKVTT